MTVVAAATLSLSKLIEVYNLLAEKQVKAFRDKPTAVARVEKVLAEQNHEIFAVEGAEGEYDVRPVVVQLTKEEIGTIARVVDAPKSEVKKGKAKKATGGKRGPAPEFSDAMKIEVLVANPKRPNTASWDRFALYGSCKTVGEFLAAGGTRADLAWDEERTFIKISK